MTNGSRRLLYPPMIMSELPPSPAAGTLDGTICARQPKSASESRNPTTPRIPEAAGITGLTMLPSGAITSMGRNSPEVFGMSACMIERTAYPQHETVNGRGELIPPRTCSEVPVKSTVSESLRTVILTRIGMGTSSTPSSSR